MHTLQTDRQHPFPQHTHENVRTHINRGREATRVLSGGDDQLVDVWLQNVLKVQLLGQLDDARGGADVEGAGTLTFGLEGVADLSIGKWLGLDRDDTVKKGKMFSGGIL